MIATLFTIFGGIGLFLIGMVLLSDGLKAFAGDALRRALVQFTGGPLKAFASGALVTAVVQSSSAVTVTLIGFVSAGLLTFPQAVGVVFGASLGTTGTGWIVSLIGLKVNVGVYALPLVGVGTFMRLLARGRWRFLGLALAGFGLIFVGIETLQSGMQRLEGVVQLAELPARGILGRLVAMLVGVALTVVMQSSSAAVATTLTALHSQSVDFEQAALLIIGATIGTTVTGALASIGASVSAKRTALAHVVFNLTTGIVAAVLLPLFLWTIALAQTHLGLEPGATSLAAFHTAFIALGVAIFLPMTVQFSRVIEWMLPERGPILTRHLDNTVLNAPAVALEATRRALSETACEVFATLRHQLADPRRATDETQEALVQQALYQTQQFFARIPPMAQDEPMSLSRVSQMHAIDHLVRLTGHLHAPGTLGGAPSSERLQQELTRTRQVLELAEAGLRGRAADDWLEQLEQRSLELAQRRREARPSVLRETARGDWDPALALNMLDALRWLDRIAYHAWRICTHLTGTGTAEPPLAQGQPDLDD